MTGTKIKEFVKQQSYFELDYETDETIAFITRENGCVGSETTGIKDVNEGLRLVKLIKQKFNVPASTEECDEWVHVNVELS